jgi:hypothetical protein
MCSEKRLIKSRWIQEGCDQNRGLVFGVLEAEAQLSCVDSYAALKGAALPRQWTRRGDPCLDG